MKFLFFFVAEVIIIFWFKNRNIRPTHKKMFNKMKYVCKKYSQDTNWVKKVNKEVLGWGSLEICCERS